MPSAWLLIKHLDILFLFKIHAAATEGCCPTSSIFMVCLFLTAFPSSKADQFCRQATFRLAAKGRLEVSHILPYLFLKTDHKVTGYWYQSIPLQHCVRTNCSFQIIFLAFTRFCLNRVKVS